MNLGPYLMILSRETIDQFGSRSWQPDVVTRSGNLKVLSLSPDSSLSVSFLYRQDVRNVWFLCPLACEDILSPPLPSWDGVHP